MPKRLQPLGPARDDWRALNRAVAHGDFNQAESVADRHNLAPLLRGPEDVRGRWHPFRIYQVFSSPPDSGDWLRFRVRAGRVMESDASGTDATDADPDQEELQAAATADYTTIPTGTANFWFWLELSGSGAGLTATVRSAADPSVAGTDNPNPWPSYPLPDATHIPIGWVDTLTNESASVAIVRQLLRTDVVSIVGGGGGLMACQITAIYGGPSALVNYFQVQRVNVSGLFGPTFYCAKSPPEYMDASLGADSYTYIDDNSRTVNGTSAPVITQVLTRSLLVGGLVFVEPVDYTGIVDPDSNPVVFLHSRTQGEWTQPDVQPV
jgi:hypothetical protein